MVPNQPTEDFALNTIMTRGQEWSILLVLNHDVDRKGRFSALYASDLLSQGRRYSKRRN
jgi:hypothetical protein